MDVRYRSPRVCCHSACIMSLYSGCGMARKSVAWLRKAKAFHLTPTTLHRSPHTRCAPPPPRLYTTVRHLLHGSIPPLRTSRCAPFAPFSRRLHRCTACTPRFARALPLFWFTCLAHTSATLCLAFTPIGSDHISSQSGGWVINSFVVPRATLWIFSRPYQFGSAYCLRLPITRTCLPATAFAAYGRTRCACRAPSLSTRRYTSLQTLPFFY